MQKGFDSQRRRNIILMKYDLEKKSNLLQIDEGTRLIRHIDNVNRVSVRENTYDPLE